MNFEFTKEDFIFDLPEPIRKHLRTFSNNRLNQFEILQEAIVEEDFEEIRLFCHAQLGVAGSYNCFKLEEITLYIQELARNENLMSIKELMPVLKSYLEELNVESQKY